MNVPYTPNTDQQRSHLVCCPLHLYHYRSYVSLSRDHTNNISTAQVDSPVIDRVVHSIEALLVSQPDSIRVVCRTPFALAIHVCVVAQVYGDDTFFAIAGDAVIVAIGLIVWIAISSSFRPK